MKRHVLYTFFVMICMFFVSGCGKNVSSQSIENDTTQLESEISADISSDNEQTYIYEETSEQNQISDVSEVGSLTNEELIGFTELFNQPEYQGFLGTAFNSPEEIDWDFVLETGAGINVKEISSTEIQDFLDATKRSNIYETENIIAVRKPDLVKFIKDHTGMTIAPDEPMLSWDYVEKYESYYNTIWSITEKHYECISGERNGDNYRLRFQTDKDTHYGQNADRILTITKSDEGLLIESNTIQWDDYCDENQTFDVDLKPNGELIHFVTYPAYADKGASFILVKNGKFVTELFTYAYRGSNSSELTEVAAVGFFDFNVDGMKDIVIIGTSDFGETILLEESVDTNYTYESCYGIEQNIETDLANNFTISKVRQALLGSNAEGLYMNYKNAYAQIAKLYNMSYDSAKYDLIYADEDDIPELVIEHNCTTSLYTYEDGYAHCLMYNWSYGAGGNTGYDYAPGKGIYYNHNNDYAGAVQYGSYMSKHKGTEVQTDYCVEYQMFEDLDGDGVPSEEELSAIEELDVHKEIYYNYTNKEMTDAEIEEKIDLLNSYDYEWLGGTMSYGELITALSGSLAGEYNCWDQVTLQKDGSDYYLYPSYENGYLYSSSSSERFPFDAKGLKVAEDATVSVATWVDVEISGDSAIPHYQYSVQRFYDVADDLFKNGHWIIIEGSESGALYFTIDGNEYADFVIITIGDNNEICSIKDFYAE